MTPISLFINNAARRWRAAGREEFPGHEILGAALRQVRLEGNMTQTEAANILGMQTSLLSNAELYKRNGKATIKMVRTLTAAIADTSGPHWLRRAARRWVSNGGGALPTPAILREILRRLRKQAGLSQYALGQKLGLSDYAVNAIESHRDTFDLTIIGRWAEACGAQLTLTLTSPSIVPKSQALGAVPTGSLEETLSQEGRERLKKLTQQLRLDS